jgi:hypothetical protein
MKTRKTAEGGEEGGWQLRKSNTDGTNLIKVLYMHICKYHNETSLYN